MMMVSCVGKYLAAQVMWISLLISRVGFAAALFAGPRSDSSNSALTAPVDINDITISAEGNSQEAIEGRSRPSLMRRAAPSELAVSMAEQQEQVHSSASLEVAKDTVVDDAHWDGNVSALFNCSSGFEQWQYGWSWAKKEWCCAHHNRACPATSPSSGGNGVIEPCTTAGCANSTGGSSPRVITGAEICDNHGFSQLACEAIGCCYFDVATQLCWSQVGTNPCVQSQFAPTPSPATSEQTVSIASGEEICEQHGFGEELCHMMHCCAWDPGNMMCHSAVGNAPCAAPSPAGNPYNAFSPSPPPYNPYHTFSPSTPPYEVYPVPVHPSPEPAPLPPYDPNQYVHVPVPVPVVMPPAGWPQWPPVYPPPVPGYWPTYIPHPEPVPAPCPPGEAAGTFDAFGSAVCPECICPAHIPVLVVPSREDKHGRANSYATGMVQWPPGEDLWHFAEVTKSDLPGEAGKCKIDFILGGILDAVDPNAIRWMKPTGRTEAQRTAFMGMSVDRTSKRALGLLTLDYAYGTQPGDVDDKRTFCTVDNEYANHYLCQDGLFDDEFELVPGMVKWMSFYNCGLGLWTDAELTANGMTTHMAAEMRQNFYDTLTFYLTNDKVWSIAADCGLFIKYQEKAEVFRDWAVQHIPGARWKPLIFSTVKLASLVVDRLKPLGNGIAFMPTSNEAGLTVDLWELLKDIGVPEGWPHKSGHNPLTSAELETRVKSCPNRSNYNFSALPGGIERLEEALIEMLWLDSTETEEEFCSTCDAVITILETTVYNATEANANSSSTDDALATSTSAGSQNASGPWRFRVVDGKIISDFGMELAYGQPHKVPTATGQFLEHFTERMAEVLVRTPDWPVQFILTECTEMPQYSNAFRAKFGLPVWDIHTLGTCLMVAYGNVYKLNPHDPRLAGSESSILRWPEFGACLDARGHEVVTKFGAQGPVLDYLNQAGTRLPDGAWSSFIPADTAGFAGYSSTWNNLAPGTLPITAWQGTNGGFEGFKAEFPNPWRSVEQYACYHPAPACNYTNFGGMGLNA